MTTLANVTLKLMRPGFDQQPSCLRHRKHLASQRSQLSSRSVADRLRSIS